MDEAITPTRTSTSCCIVGGGPAGMMLGYLLARAGVRVVVLEKHADFLRDFRGDTVHPSTLRVMQELGLLDEFMQRPHQKLREIGGWFGRESVRLGDFGGLPERLRIHRDDAAVGVPRLPLGRGEEAAGVRAAHAGQRRANWCSTADGSSACAAPSPAARSRSAPTSSVGCDGRHSTVRAAAGLAVEDVGAPIDVLWFRISRDPSETDQSLARIGPGHIVVTIDRGDYWQCAFVIPKGGADALRAQDIGVLREQVVKAAPPLASRIADLRSWDDVKLLTVTVDRLTEWSRPGLLCIGDAAHAMSPVGGVGINLAIQDAVATANLLAEKLRDGTLEDDDLDAVRERRLWPTKATQALQIGIQDNVLAPVLSGANAELEVPLPMRLLSSMRPLRRLFARLLGMGVRPEHVRSPVA